MITTRCLRQLLPIAIGTLFCLPLFGDTIGVKVSANAQFDTNGVFPGSGYCGDPNYPNCNVTKTGQGLTSASALVSESGTTGPLTNPAGTSSSAFASVSATEGHIGLSFSADSEGIGFSGGSGSASWNDVMTISSGSLAPGTTVTLTATLGITAEFVGLGEGSANVHACFSDATDEVFVVCTSGSDGTGQALVLPATVTQQFQGYVGEVLNLAGNASGEADSNAYATFNEPGSPDASWSLLATNSAHFSISSDTAGVDLSLASGCSITSGYGCDPVPSDAVPEPASLPLMLGGLLLAGLVWRRAGLLQE